MATLAVKHLMKHSSHRRAYRSCLIGFFFCSIDCAGILKLRNADIELRKGETDIGRKNTRVRVVFRVSVPQPDGRVLWLQTASAPVECCESPVMSHVHLTFYSLSLPVRSKVH